ncbi:MAG: putative 10 [Firmicutes bacterium]|nr:putative 10 [Bacillota bacterium]
MGQWRKKPVVVEAEVYKLGMEDGWVVYYSNEYDTYESRFKTKEAAEEFIKIRPFVIEENDLIIETPQPFIKTLEGPHIIRKGDYIITGVKGERYPCKPDIFHETYEKAENAS